MYAVSNLKWWKTIEKEELNWLCLLLPLRNGFRRNAWQNRPSMSVLLSLLRYLCAADTDTYEYSILTNAAQSSLVRRGWKLEFDTNYLLTFIQKLRTLDGVDFRVACAVPNESNCILSHTCTITNSHTITSWDVKRQKLRAVYD